MLLPAGVAIDPETGAVTPSTGRYEKRLSDLREKALLSHVSLLRRDVVTHDQEADRVATGVVPARDGHTREKLGPVFAPAPEQPCGMALDELPFGA